MPKIETLVIIYQEDTAKVNFHVARIKSPGQFIRFRTQKNQGGRGVDFLIGFRAGGGSEVQSIRFAKTIFTPTEARQWLRDHDFTAIKFESAREPVTA